MLTHFVKLPVPQILAQSPVFWVLSTHTQTHTHTHVHISSVQFSSVAQSCLTLCIPMDSSTPGFPVHHQLPELAQIRVHRVSDALQPSHPLLSSSPPAFNLNTTVVLPENIISVAL